MRAASVRCAVARGRAGCGGGEPTKEAKVRSGRVGVGAGAKLEGEDR